MHQKLTFLTGGPGVAWLAVADGVADLRQATLAVSTAMPPAGRRLQPPIAVLALEAFTTLATVRLTHGHAHAVITSEGGEKRNGKPEKISAEVHLWFPSTRSIYHIKSNQHSHYVSGSGCCLEPTCCSDRGSALLLGHTGSRCVRRDSHRSLPSLLLPSMHPGRTRCTNDTPPVWHHPLWESETRSNQLVEEAEMKSNLWVVPRTIM